MENQQVALAQELDRRLAVLQTDEVGDDSHRALSSSELWTAFIIVTVTLAIGLVVVL